MICFLLFTFSLTVDASRYRDCDSSPFCKRNRFLKDQNWVIDANSAKVENNIFIVTIDDKLYNNQLTLSVSFLKSGSIRVKVNPQKKESFTRYDVSKEPTVINQRKLGSLITPNFEKSGNSLLVSANGLVLQIFTSPFVISLKSKDGLTTTINFDNSAVFETKRILENNPALFESYQWGGHTDKFPNGPSSVGMSFKISASNIRISGLAPHTLPLSIQSTINSEPIRFFNTDLHRYEVYSGMGMYGSIPFFIAHSFFSSLGLLWLNPSETYVDVNNQSNDESTIRFISESGFIDFFLFPGNPKSISNSFTKLTGRPQLPSIFTLGFHQCRWGYLTQEKVIEVSKGLDEINVPHDVLWLDLDYTDDRKYFTFHPSNFHDPHKLQDYLEISRRKLTVLIDPHLKADTSYPIYEEARKKDLFIKDASGGQYYGNCWPGRSSWPDFLNPETRSWWETLFQFSKWKESHSNLYLWNDMNEISVFESADGTAPKDLLHFGGYEEREVHNLYGHLMVSASFGGLVKRSVNQNNRPFILTRSYFIGTSKYAFAWSGDNTADWSHLANSIPLVLSNGIAGMVYIGEDVSGFFDNPSPELLSRWYQVAAWCYSFFRCHCHHEGENREIYTLKGDLQKSAVEAVQERYKLLPYWYLLSRISNLTGQPILRPMWWEFNSKEMIDRDDIAMLGKWILVVPFLKEGNSDIELDLPKNSRWYDFRSLVEMNNPKIIAKYDGGRTAVFIRGGGIVPMKTRIRKSSAFMFNDPYTLVIALDENQQATGELYEDDEDTFDFASGSYVHKQYNFDGKTLQSQTIKGNQNSQFVINYDVVIERIQITGLKKNPKVITNSSGKKFEFSVTGNVLTIHRAKLLVKEDWILQFQ